MTEYIKNPLSGKLRGVTYEDGKIIDVHIRDTDDVVKVFVPLDNGVTVQEWVSVKDRLPKLTEEEIESFRLFGDTFFPEFNVMILGATRATTLYYDGKRWYDEGNKCYCVTHWQPMPQPPKGE